MADKKISALTTLTQANVAGTADFLPIVDTSATETKKATPEAVVLGTLGATTANVGIGTASPSHRLDVYRSSYGVTARFFTADGTNNPRLVIYGNASGTTIQNTFSASAANLMFAVGGAEGAGTEVGRFDGNGNFGIGTTSPSVKLEVLRGSEGEYLRAGGDDTGNNGRALRFTSSTNGGFIGAAHTLNAPSSGGAIAFATNSAERMRITSTGNVVAGASAALATNATDGFLYVPTCAGTPTGTPTAITGMAPIVVNTTNNKLYFYSGGAWRDAGP